MAVPEPDESMNTFQIYNDKGEEIASWGPVGGWYRLNANLTKNIRINIAGFDGVLYSTVNNDTEILYESSRLPFTIPGDIYLTLSNLNATEATLGFYYYNDNKNATLSNIPIEASDSSLLGVTENRSLDYI